jgi:hypothetical protein
MPVHSSGYYGIQEPTGLLGSRPVHQEANERLSKEGLSAVGIDNLNAATEHIDSPKYQTSEFAYVHAMRAPGQSIAEARKKANEFVREKFALAWKYKAEGNIPRSEFEFGLALHTLQEPSSPTHINFPPWVGKVPVIPTLVAHGFDERDYPGDNSELHRVTQEAYKWYLSGKLPDGDLFPPVPMHTRIGIVYGPNGEPITQWMKDKEQTILEQEKKQFGTYRESLEEPPHAPEVLPLPRIPHRYTRNGIVYGPDDKPLGPFNAWKQENFNEAIESRGSGRNTQ